MIHLKQAVIVEGKYDKIKLSSIIDALIITTDGFSVFKDKEKIALIKGLAEKDGVIVLTDSDSAGFKIRNYIKGCTQKGKITNVYIPDIFGKEKRKVAPSKEGKIGVEGIPSKILIEAFVKAGVTVDSTERGQNEVVTRIRLYDDGFIGQADSAEKRKKLLRALSLPAMLSTGALLEVLNSMFTVEEYEEAVKSIGQ
ncbi:MAG: DUF4093 domain-containing protein [Oscillospiraceae bacterium]|nr:DUF4093 domain-containing protein [Oscillospiraceae bacterium]